MLHVLQVFSCMYSACYGRPHWRCVRGWDQSALGVSDTPTSHRKLPRSENDLDLSKKLSKCGINTNFLRKSIGYLIVGSIIDQVGRMQMWGKYLDSVLFDDFCRHFFCSKWSAQLFSRKFFPKVKGHRRVCEQCKWQSCCCYFYKTKWFEVW